MPPLAAALPGILINAAIGVGASVLANAMRPQKAQQTQQQTSSRGLKFDLSVGEATALSAVWGLGRTAGQLTFVQEYAENNSWMKLKFDCGRGWFGGLDGVIADEKRLTLTGSNSDVHGFVAEEYRDASGNPRAWFKYYDGVPGQLSDVGLIAAAPTRWGVAHTSTATPYVIVTLNYHADLFTTSSLPSFGFIWRGLRLYDWRKDSTMPGGLGAHRWADQSTWEWTENPAVIAWNFRRGYWRNGVKLFGMGFSRFANDLDYFTAAANLADEDMYFEETGATLARYAFGREISDDEEHLSVLRQLEESWCGSSFDRGGAYAPVPAARRTSVLTLTDADLVEGQPVLADKWGKVSSKKTQIHGTFGSVADLFVPTPFGTRINVALEALTRGPKTDALDQPYEHRIERAQNRAEITLRRHNFGASRKETFTAAANVLEPGDVFTRNCSWGPTLMMVDAIEQNPDGPGRTITAVAWSNSIVPDADEGFIELPADSGVGPVPAARTLQVPAFGIEALQRVTGGNEEPFARATWSLIEDPLCDQVVIRVWPTAIPAEIEEFSAEARLAGAKIIGPLRPNTAYTGVATLTRRDLRRTYDTDQVLFTTGAFRPGEIGPNDLSAALNAARAQASRSIERLQADSDAMVAHFADAMLGGAVDRHTMRTEITARFDTTTAAYTHAVDVVASAVGAVVIRTELLEAAVADPTTGLVATATALDVFKVSVNADLEAKAEAITAVEASIGDVLAGGAIGIIAEAAPSGFDVSAYFALKGASTGNTFQPVGLYMRLKSDGTRLMILDADNVVYTGRQRSVNGLSYWDMDTGDIVSTGFFSFGS